MKFLIYFPHKRLSTLGHSLYKICRLVFKPLLVNRLWILWYAVFNSSRVRISKVPHEWCLNRNMVGHKYIFVASAVCDWKPSFFISVKFPCQIH